MSPRVWSVCFSLGLALMAGAAVAGEPPAPARPEVDQALASLAAGRTDVRMRRSRKGLLRFIAAGRGRGFALSSAKGAPPEQRADAFIAAHGAAFGLGRRPETRRVRVTPRDRVGLEHVRVQQMYRGIPVTGAEMMVHLDGDSVRSANGHLLDVDEIGDLDISPRVSEAGAQDIAAGVVRDAYGASAPTPVAPRLEVFNRGVLDHSDAPTLLAWFVEVRAPQVREYVWVDAQDGSVLLHFNQQPHALNRTIYDATSSFPGVIVRTEGQPATGDTDVDALYAHLKSAYDYFLSEHERDSYDGGGAPVVGVAHLPGENAAWNNIDARFEFSNDFPPADDIVAHEFTHAVDTFTANLFYSFEPGALNESFSDMFGETVDLLDGTGNDQPEVRWLFGEDVPGLGAGRDMMEPNAFGNPGRVSDPLFHCESDDYFGVHSNSGVPNHAYALMVDGGTYNGHTVHGIGLHKAGHIAYRALTYLTSASGFQEASDAFEQACSDLTGQYGIAAPDCVEVQNALEAVEMPTARTCHAVYVRIRQAGAGSGLIKMLRNPDWVDCSPEGVCDAYFPEGEPMRLLAEPALGSIFSGWAGDGCTGTIADCRPLVTGDTMEIVAVFDPDGSTHTVNVSISGSTTGAAVTSDPPGISCGTDCSEAYPAGTFVTLTATAAPGSVLTHWRGACSGVGPTCTLAMTGPMNVTAEFGPIPFTAERSLGSGSAFGGAAWGDYDGDGDLDLVLVDKGRTVVYRNDSGSFVDIGAPLAVFADDMAAAWGDYDNDGDIDLAVSGRDASRNHVLKVYRNDRGTFVDSGISAPGVGGTYALSWVDYDNDGDLDLALSGSDSSGGPAALLRNDRGTLVDSGIPFPEARDMQWGDYDGDGDLDVLVASHSLGNGSASTLYRNDGGVFLDSGMAADPAASLHVAWVDYDGDGRLDLTVSNDPMLHRNVGGELTPVRTALPWGWDFAWGDADADGDWDLLRLGAPRPTGRTDSVFDSLLLEHGPGGLFTPIASGLPVANGAPACWGDYDNDGRLDLYLQSSNVVYRSSYGATNTRPQPPASVTTILSADGVRLVWTPGSDGQTPSTGLSYNVRVGTTVFGSEIVSAMSDALTGRRFVAQAGNAGSNLFYVLKGLAPGHYYYTVQSIDTSFAGSGFINGSFDYPPTVSTSVNVTDDWGTGYCADLTITNISSSSVTGWQSSFARPGGGATTITSLWSFRYTSDGPTVTLRPLVSNRTIAAGQSVTGGFCANGPTGAKYQLQVLTNGLGSGSVSASPVGIECGLDCSESYPGGTTVTLTATPDVGSTFLRWDGACTGSSPTCTVTMGPGGASTVAWFMRATAGNVTITPVVAQRQPYYNEEHVRIKNPTALTALSITVVVQRTAGITYNGQFNTVGSQIQHSHSVTAATITYRFTLAPGQTLSPGEWTFAAQTNGTGTSHPTSGDTYSVTYTAGGQTYTQTGTF